MTTRKPSPPRAPKQKPVKIGSAASSYAADLRAAQDVSLHDENHSLARKYAKLLKEKGLTERLIEIAKDVAPLSYEVAPTIKDPAWRHISGKKGTPHKAVLIFSDQHIGQNVYPSQTMGFGGYGWPVFKDRTAYLEDSVVSICRDHTTTDITELVIFMLGDTIHGALKHGSEAAQQNTIFTQCYAGAHCIAQFFRRLSPHFPKITVKTAVGNHPRFGDQHRVPSENRFSNFDMFTYALVEALVRDIPTINFDLNRQPFCETDICGYKFWAGHGDHLRGGDKNLGIPNHAIGRQIAVTDQLYNKYRKYAINYFLVGHFHRPIVVPHANGLVLFNGGYPGLDNYALASNFNPCEPVQKFFLMHERHGIAAQYDLQLAKATPGSGERYIDQVEFPMA